MRRFTPQNLIFLILIISSFSIPLLAHQVLVLLTNEELKDAMENPQGDDAAVSDGEWDDLGAFDMKPDYDFDPGSWRPLFEDDGGENSTGVGDGENSEYYSALEKMIASVGAGDTMGMYETASEIESAALAGHPHAQSVLGFLYSMGMTRARDGAKALLYHHFAADGGNVQSKLVLAYTYFRQEMYDKAVALYAELAELAVNSFMISKDSPLMEPVRIHSGTEETKLAKGEEDEEFQIMEYEADRGNAEAMHHVGLFHFYGLRGMKRDHKKAFSWFLKAAVKEEPKSMEILAEIYARGIGVERNYSKALEWLKHATKLNYFYAYNGMGYLYVKGHGVEKNITKSKEYFKLASENKDAGGLYNLAIMHLKGIGVKRDPVIASQYLIISANKGQPKAFYQLAKMFHKGLGMRSNLPKAITLYKIVAERGSWGSMSRWALESYAKGDLGKALFLYLRIAELGFEVAQSNAAWILDKYGDQSMCVGESGFCTESERYQRAHILWWQASEQGNEHAALLIGDAVTSLKCRASMISSSKEIVQVGTIFANSEREIGELIPKPMERAERKGMIKMVDGKMLDQELEVVEGMKLGKRYISPCFITYQSTKTFELEDPLILIHGKSLRKTEGSMAATNLLKPMIARGQLRRISVTTREAYSKDSLEELFHECLIFIRGAEGSGEVDFDELPLNIFEWSNGIAEDKKCYSKLNEAFAKNQKHGMSCTLERSINGFFIFSLPRPPEAADLEDKVDFKGGGMLRSDTLHWAWAEILLGPSFPHIISI